MEQRVPPYLVWYDYNKKVTSQGGSDPQQRCSYHFCHLICSSHPQGMYDHRHHLLHVKWNETDMVLNIYKQNSSIVCTFKIICRSISRTSGTHLVVWGWLKHRKPNIKPLHMLQDDKSGSGKSLKWNSNVFNINS